MQSSCNKDDQSLAPFFITCSSLWNSHEQSKFSPSKSVITGPESSNNEFCHVKQSDSLFQEQDSSSTLSTCQSQFIMAEAARNSTSSGETHGRHAEQYQRSPLSCVSADFAVSQVQLDYNKSLVSPSPLFPRCNAWDCWLGRKMLTLIGHVLILRSRDLQFYLLIHVMA